MKNIQWLKDKYIIFLEDKQGEFKKSIEELQEGERLDEANLEKIKLNVVEIFHKMFNISLSDKPMALKEKYLGFFDKITKPWYANKDKALEFGKENDLIVEEIKIKEAEELKEKFNEYYSQLDIN